MDLEDEDNFKDEPEHEKCQMDYDETRRIHDGILDVSRQVLSQPRATTPNVAQSTTNGPSKIDDTLKPRQELLRSFMLEEANVWFDGFTAYFKHNEKALQKLPASVCWQILNNSIKAALAKALQADDQISAATHIIGDDGCLS